MNKAIFLDRDGTINVEKGYLFKKENFEFIDGAVNAMRILQKAGYLLIIITNQSGIARGYYREEDFYELNEWMEDQLASQGVEIDAVYFCPHYPEALISTYNMNCNCRKPKLGLFQKAVKDFDIDLGLSFAIGDKIRDCAICQSTECRGFLISENEDREITEAVKNGKYKNIRYAMDLKDAAEKILE